MMVIHAIPLSSNIETLGYDKEGVMVRVAFKRKSGGVAIWEYWPVLERDFEAIRDAESVGHAVNTYLVNGPYNSRRVA